MRNTGSHSGGIFGHILAALAMAAVFGAAFIVGCVKSFADHPWEWIRDDGFYVLLILVGLAGGMVESIKSRR